ncbi:MAG: hypothetical protein K6E94_05570 [Elusimicrobiaceae bacterium]|nr:hypothetical protein [Elusimicrobiaceae bacterium]
MKKLFVVLVSVMCVFSACNKGPNPKDSLIAVGKALQDCDADSVDKYIDISSIISNAIDVAARQEIKELPKEQIMGLTAGKMMIVPIAKQFVLEGLRQLSNSEHKEEIKLIKVKEYEILENKDGIASAKVTFDFEDAKKYALDKNLIPEEDKSYLSTEAVPLVLKMKQTGDHWQITEIANLDKIIKKYAPLYMEKQKQQQEKMRQAQEEWSRQQEERMKQWEQNQEERREMYKQEHEKRMAMLEQEREMRIKAQEERLKMFNEQLQRDNEKRAQEQRMQLEEFKKQAANRPPSKLTEAQKMEILEKNRRNFERLKLTNLIMTSQNTYRKTNGTYTDDLNKLNLNFKDIEGIVSKNTSSFTTKDGVIYSIDKEKAVANKPQAYIIEQYYNGVIVCKDDGLGTCAEMGLISRSMSENNKNVNGIYTISPEERQKQLQELRNKDIERIKKVRSNPASRILGLISNAEYNYYRNNGTYTDDFSKLNFSLNNIDVIYKDTSSFTTKDGMTYSIKNKEKATLTKPQEYVLEVSYKTNELICRDIANGGCDEIGMRSKSI